MAEPACMAKNVRRAKGCFVKVAAILPARRHEAAFQLFFVFERIEKFVCHPQQDLARIGLQALQIPALLQNSLFALQKKTSGLLCLRLRYLKSLKMPLAYRFDGQAFVRNSIFGMYQA